MFKLNNTFLEDIGLASMPEEQKEVFLDHVQEELEIRVGEKMSMGLSDEQIEEFEKIIDGDKNAIMQVVSRVGDYKNHEVYQKLLANGFTDEGEDTLAEFASVQWLADNRSDYAQIVEDAVAQLKIDTLNNKDIILAKA